MPRAGGNILDSAYMFDAQEPSVLNQANPDQNIWYPVLVATQYCRVYRVAINVEDTDEDLEARITCNGFAYGDGAIAAVNSTQYYVSLQQDAINRVVEVRIQAAGADSFRRSIVVEGLSVTIEVRKTSNNGVGNLTGVADYGVLTLAF